MPEQPIGGKCTFATDCKGWGWGFNGRGVMCYGGECGEPGPREWDERKSGVPTGGETCNLHEDCRGYGLGSTDTACCSWRCKKKLNGACPGEFGNAGAALGESCTVATDCQGHGHLLGGIGIMCKGGVCAEPGLGEVGTPCNLNEDCKDYGTGETAAACCGYKCAKKIKSWCPGEGGNAGADIGGSCNISEDCKNYGWGVGGDGNQCWKNVCTPPGPQKEGGSCNVGLDCEGHEAISETGLACCNNKCTEKKNFWCPGEGANAGAPIGGGCRASTDCQMWGPGLGGKNVTCYGGTCDYPGERELGESCSWHEECKDAATSSIPIPILAAATSGIEGTCCSQNICTMKEDGWCPDDPYRKFAEDAIDFAGDVIVGAVDAGADILGDVGDSLFGDVGGFFGKIKRYLIIGGTAIVLFALIGVTLKIGYMTGMSKKVMALVGGIMFLVAVAIIIVVVFATKETYKHQRRVRPSSPSTSAMKKNNLKRKKEKPLMMTTWLDLRPTNTTSKRPNFNGENIL
jgi:hypothetical protein